MSGTPFLNLPHSYLDEIADPYAALDPVTRAAMRLKDAEQEKWDDGWIKAMARSLMGTADWWWRKFYHIPVTDERYINCPPQVFLIEYWAYHLEEMEKANKHVDDASASAKVELARWELEDAQEEQEAAATEAEQRAATLAVESLRIKRVLRHE